MRRLAFALGALALGTAPAWGDPASDAAGEIVKQWGVPGALLVVAGCAIVALAWRYSALWDARLADAKAAAADLRAANKEMSDALNASSKTSAALTVAVESQGREAERRHADLKGDLAAIQDVKTIVSGNAESMRRIESDVRPQARGPR